MTQEFKLAHMHLQIKVDFLTNYLDHIVKEAIEEIKNIEDRNEVGEFKVYGALENQLDYPFKRIELAARTIYYEVNSIFESFLQEIALEPWMKSNKYPGPKTINFPNISIEKIKSLKMINDLYFNQLINLIEKEYKLKVSVLPGAQVLFDLRDKVNEFKHRDGFIDFRKQKYQVGETINLLERYRPSEEEAHSALASIQKFCFVLWEIKYGTS